MEHSFINDMLMNLIETLIQHSTFDMRNFKTKNENLP